MENDSDECSSAHQQILIEQNAIDNKESYQPLVSSSDEEICSNKPSSHMESVNYDKIINQNVCPLIKTKDVERFKANKKAKEKKISSKKCFSSDFIQKLTNIKLTEPDWGKMVSDEQLAQMILQIYRKMKPEHN